MKISEFIETLKEAQKEFGDLELTTFRLNQVTGYCTKPSLKHVGKVGRNLQYVEKSETTTATISI